MAAEREMVVFHGHSLPSFEFSVFSFWFLVFHRASRVPGLSEVGKSTDSPTSSCLAPLPSRTESVTMPDSDRSRGRNRKACGPLQASDEWASNGRAVPVVVGNPRLSENDQPRGPTTRGRGTPGERAPGHLSRLRSRPPAHEQRARRRSGHPRHDHAARATLGRPGPPRRPRRPEMRDP